MATHLHLVRANGPGFDGVPFATPMGADVELLRKPVVELAMKPAEKARRMNRQSRFRFDSGDHRLFSCNMSGGELLILALFLRAGESLLLCRFQFPREGRVALDQIGVV